MEMRIPLYVENILHKLNSGGYQSYLVGGCVRDLMMEKVPHDYDIATDATPDQVEEVFKKNRTLDVGKRFGTVILLTEYGNVEITTFRADGTYSDGRKPDAVFFSNSIIEDISRRDFTINAMAYHPEEGILDVFEGTGDLEKKLIRTVGEPTERFSEDHLRMLRCIRFATVLDFKIHHETFEAVRTGALFIRQISAERIREEMIKIILSDHVDYGLHLLCRSELVHFILPSLGKFEEDEPERFEVLCDKIKNAECKLLLRLSILFYFLRDSRDLYGIRPTNEERESIEGVLKFRFPLKITRVTVKTMMNEMKSSILTNALETFSACGVQRKNVEEFLKLRRAVEESREPYRISDLEINGEDLLRAGVQKGPEVGKILKDLNEFVIEDPMRNTRECLMNYIQEIRK